MHRPTFIIGLLTLLLPAAPLFLWVTYLFIVPVICGITLIALSFGSWARQYFKYSIVAAIFAWISPYALIAYSFRSYHIEMIVPRDYVGELTIIRDRKKGGDVQKFGEYYRLDFSESQTIYLADPWILHRWSQTRVSTKDGQLLVDEARPTEGPRTLNALGSTLGTKQTGPGSWSSSSDYDGTQYRWRLELPTKQSLSPTVPKGG